MERYPRGESALGNTLDAGKYRAAVDVDVLPQASDGTRQRSARQVMTETESQTATARIEAARVKRIELFLGGQEGDRPTTDAVWRRLTDAWEHGGEDGATDMARRRPGPAGWPPCRRSTAG